MTDSMAARPAALRLAVLGINYAPEEIGIGRYTTDLARVLADRGHIVEVIAGKPYYPRWEVPAAYRGAGWRRSVEQGVAITRCPHYVPAIPTGLRRVVHLASFAVAALSPALGLALRPRARRPQVVLCVAPALLSVPVAWLAARFAGARLWVHVQDFEVEAALATGLLPAGNIAAPAAHRIESLILALADRISSISPQMCRRLTAKGIEPARVTELRNWAEPASLGAETGGSTYRSQWGLGQTSVALYSGNIANKQGVETIVEAARLLAGRRDITFVICGDGPNRPRLEEAAAGLDNILFQPLQPSARLGELLALASVHLLPQIAGAADLVLPSKLTNMLASGRPVVATAEPGTGLHDEVTGCGICTAPGDAPALAAAIVDLVDDPERCAELGAEGRRRANARWSREAILDRLEHELRQLAGPATELAG